MSNKITYQFYEFLCDLGVPYEGEIFNVGRAYCQPVVLSNTIPEDQSITHGNFLTTRYISVIGPSAKVSENETVQEVYEQLFEKRPDGSIVFWDLNDKVHRKFSKDAKVGIKIENDYVTIRIEDKDKPAKTYYHAHLDIYYSDLKNITPPEVSFGKLLADGFGTDISANSYFFQNSKTKVKSKQAYDFKKMAKKFGINIQAKNSTIYREIAPRVLKNAGRVMFGISLGFTVGDSYNSGGFQASHLIDGTLLALTFVSGGWVIGGAYFLIDLCVITYTYNNTGHTQSIGDFINNGVEKIFSLEDGKIIEY